MIHLLTRFGLPLVVILLSLSCRTTRIPVASIPVDSLAGIPARIMSADWETAQTMDSVIASLSLEEKVSQMVMVRAFGHYISTDSESFERLARLVTERRIGGIMMAQGDVYEEAILINRLQRLARLPLLVAADYERGLAMRIRRGTSFPDAMALGATRKPDLAYRMGRAIALESRAIGVHQNYAPVADINSNPGNPVINTRAFGDDPGLVRDMVIAFSRGTADGGAIATVKHFPGHGTTGTDSHLELPVLELTRARLDSMELSTFRSAVESGARSVMIGHIAAPALDSLRLPASLSPGVVQGVLRSEMGFGGLVVTDAMEMKGVTRNFLPGEAAVRAVRAGVDILVTPPDEDIAIASIVRAVRNGEIPESRITASVQRILQVKRWLGLGHQRLVDIDAIGSKVATRPHRSLAREIARGAVTILRNGGGILPLLVNGRRRITAVFVSDTEDNRTDVNRPGTPATSELFGTYFAQLLHRRSPALETLRLTPASDPADLSAALAKMRKSDITLLCLYVKVRTSSGKIGLPDYVRQFVEQTEELKTPVVVCTFGNPYAVASFPKAEALVCAYGDNEALTEATAEALFGEIPVHGKLPVAIPGQYAFGSGIEIPQTQLRQDDPAIAGFDAEELARVDEIVNQAIADSAFPGAQVAIVKDGLLVYNRSFGRQTYDPDSREIDSGTFYDLASLTKVVATTTAVMRLHDLQKLNLDDHIGKYLPAFAQGEKSAITIRHLFLHRGGFPPFRQLWKLCPDSAAALDSVFATPLVAAPGDSTIYSDLGMIILGKIVERVAGMSLDSYVRKEFFEPLRMTSTMYVPNPSLRERIAPTEIDTTWRRRIVRGTVHDENAEILGGVSGHAGLFSTASDLAVFMQLLLNKGTYGGRRYISEGTIYEFLVKKSPGQERWLGWDMKSARGSSSGSYFSSSSFGHTGFTGTSLWADPERNLAVIFLTNRVFPTRANGRLSKVRPALHDAVLHALVRAGQGE